MIKQISDLSVAELSDLNSNCKFVMDDSNKKTKQVSFSVIESKFSSEIQKTVENSFNDKLDILLEKLDSLESRVMDYEGNMNCLDYGSTLTFKLDEGKKLSSDAMPFDCQIQFPQTIGRFNGNIISVDSHSLTNKLIQATSSMYYCNVACGQDFFFRNPTNNSTNIDIIPYRYGLKNIGSDISTLNLQELNENSILHINRCLYGGTNSNKYLTSFTELTDFGKTDIYYQNNKSLEYRLVIELSSSENIIGLISELDTLPVITSQNGHSIKPSLSRKYRISNEILSEKTTFSNAGSLNINSKHIFVPKNQFLYLTYYVRYGNSLTPMPSYDSLVNYPSFNELLNGVVHIATPNIQII